MRIQVCGEVRDRVSCYAVRLPVALVSLPSAMRRDSIRTRPALLPAHQPRARQVVGTPFPEQTGSIECVLGDS